MALRCGAAAQPVAALSPQPPPPRRPSAGAGASRHASLSPQGLAELGKVFQSVAIPEQKTPAQLVEEARRGRAPFFCWVQPETRGPAARPNQGRAPTQALRAALFSADNVAAQEAEEREAAEREAAEREASQRRF